MKRYICIISLLLCICGLCRAQKPFQPDSPRLFEYSNDTIRQSVEVSLLDDSGISFKLTTENKLRKKTAVKQGVATNKLKDFGASETDEDETGSLYPVVEYTYEGDCWIAFRFDEKYGRLRIKEADNEKPVPGCPLKSVGVLAVKKEKTSIKNLESDTLYVERIESLDDNRDILYINRNGENSLYMRCLPRIVVRLTTSVAIRRTGKEYSIATAYTTMLLMAIISYSTIIVTAVSISQKPASSVHSAY